MYHIAEDGFGRDADTCKKLLLFGRATISIASVLTPPVANASQQDSIRSITAFGNPSSIMLMEITCIPKKYQHLRAIRG